MAFYYGRFMAERRKVRVYASIPLQAFECTVPKNASQSMKSAAKRTTEDRQRLAPSCDAKSMRRRRAAQCCAGRKRIAWYIRQGINVADRPHS
jgi:hypothetical protein